MTPTAQKLEALLGLAGEAVTKQELQRLLHISLQELEALLMEVQEALRDHGITLIQTDREVELTTSPSVAPWLSAYVNSGTEEELTPAAVETLAIVAYVGPLTRGEIDVLRGVDSRRMLRSLRERGLVRRYASGGRAPAYEVSEEFLKHLGIPTREQLPRWSELSSREKISALLISHT